MEDDCYLVKQHGDDDLYAIVQLQLRITS